MNLSRREAIVAMGATGLLAASATPTLADTCPGPCQNLTAPVRLIGEGPGSTIINGSLRITVPNPTDSVIIRDLTVTGSITIITAASQIGPAQGPWSQHAQGVIFDGGHRPVLINNVVVGEWNQVEPSFIDLRSCMGATLDRVTRLGPDIPAGYGILIRGGGIPCMIRISDCNIHNAEQGILVSDWTEGLTIDGCHLVDCVIGLNVSTNAFSLVPAIPAGIQQLIVHATHMNTRMASMYLSGIDVAFLDNLYLINQGSSTGIQAAPDCANMNYGKIVTRVR